MRLILCSFAVTLLKSTVQGAYLCNPDEKACVECFLDDCADSASYASESACRTDTKSPCFDETIEIEGDNAKAALELLWQCGDPEAGCVSCTGVDDCIADLGTYPTADECAADDANECNAESDLAAFEIEEGCVEGECKYASKTLWQCRDPESGCTKCSGNDCIPDLGAFDSEEECAADSSNECKLAPVESPVRWQCIAGGCTKCWSILTCIADKASYKTLQECLSSNCSIRPPASYQCVASNGRCTSCGHDNEPPCLPDLEISSSREECELGDNYCFPQGGPDTAGEPVVQLPGEQTEGITKFVCIGLYHACDECSNEDECSSEYAYNTKEECENNENSICYRDPAKVKKAKEYSELLWQCGMPEEGCASCSGADDCVGDLRTYPSEEECEADEANECRTGPKTLWQCGDPDAGCQTCSGVNDCIPDLAAFDSEEECVAESSNQCKLATKTLWQCGGDPGAGCRTCSGVSDCIPDLPAFNSEEECAADSSNECKLAPKTLWQCGDPSAGCRTCSGVSDCIPDLAAFNSEVECVDDSSNECKLTPKTLWQCGGDPDGSCRPCSGVSDCIPDLAAYDSEEECVDESPNQCKLSPTRRYQCLGSGAGCVPCGGNGRPCIPDLKTYEGSKNCQEESNCSS